MKIHSYHFFSECVLYIQHKRQHTYLISVYNWYLCSNMILSHVLTEQPIIYYVIVLTEQPIIYYVIEYNLQCHVNWHCCYWTYNFIFMSERRRHGDRFNEAEIKFFNSIMIFFLLIWKKLKKFFSYEIRMQAQEWKVCLLRSITITLILLFWMSYLVEIQKISWVHPKFLVLIIFLVFYVVLLCVFTFWVPCCGVCFEFRIKPMFGSSLPPVVCRRVLFILFVFAWVAHSDDQHMLCCVFLRIVCFVLPISLGCPILIVPSVFSNVYLRDIIIVPLFCWSEGHIW